MFKKSTSVNILECVITLSMLPNMGGWLCIWHHVSFLLEQQNSVCVVGSNSTQSLSCVLLLPVTLTSGKSQPAWECGDGDQQASFSWRVALCPWLLVPFSHDSAAGFLFAWYIGVV